MSTDGGPLLDLVSRVPTGPDSLRLRVLHLLVHESIRYERTYFPGTPSEILTRGTGDCKAFAQVFCAGARHLGFPAKVVHGLLASPDGYYAHAWVTVRTPNGWQEWDPTSSYPFPDARYLRFSVPREAASAFDGELAIFSLDSIRVWARPGIDLAP
jgi:transglutaminase-like putative cysteine protease